MKPGDQLGHYRILEPLGAGGMGEVYVAEDLSLERRVALKVLPEAVSGDAERRGRFIREAKAVAALSHPNIVVIHSVEEEGERAFLTMELVDGAPLSHRIAGGPIPLGELFDLAIPLADAVSAAHHRGITHRDLKPDNVMITRDRRVKVLDFGLAKIVRDDEESALAAASTAMHTEEGKILGTVAYMSPEQAQGKGVDARSDIFSLGILLYEMATGRRPFDGDSKISILSSLIKDAPVPATELNRALPRHLGRIIRHCLEKDPERRYQSALDVRNELQSLREEIRSGEVDLPTGEHVLSGPDRVGVTSGATHRSSTGAGRGLLAGVSRPPIDPISTPTLPTGRRPAARVFMLIALLALSAAALWWGLGSSRETEDDAVPLLAASDVRPSVAVLPFDNSSDADELEWLRDGIAEMLVTDLSQAAGLRVLGGERIREILAEMGRGVDALGSLDTVREVASRAGAATVVAGSFVQAGDRLRIAARIVDASTGEVTDGESFDGVGQESVFGSVDGLSRWIRGTLEPTPAASAAPVDRDLTDVTTDSVEAFRFYAEGVKRQDRGQYPEAIEFFEEAVRLDPEFALAYVKLSTTYGNLLQYEQRDRYAERALELADRLSERERYYLEGAYYGSRLETNDRAIDAYERAIELYPDDSASRNNLAIQLGVAHRHEEAARRLEEAIQRGTTFQATWTNLILQYLVLGRLDDAEALALELRENETGSAAAAAGWGDVLIAAGRFDEARTFLQGEAAGIQSFDVGGRAFAVALYLEDWDWLERIIEVRLPVTGQEWLQDALRWRVMAFRGQVRDAIAVAGAFPEVAGDLSGRVRVQAAALSLEMGDAEGALERALAERDGATGLVDEMAALAVAARARAALGRMAAVESLVRDHEALAERGPGPHEQRDHLLLRGQLALAAGRPREAVALLQQAAELLPSEHYRNSPGAVVWHELGRAYLELEDAVRAEELFRRAREDRSSIMYPVQSVRSLYFLGRLLAQRGDEAGARAAYEHFLAYWGEGDIDRDRVAEARAYLQG
jgi:serine/threonine protein kinase/TolB-like protein/tetratricopeptide (TPR) repeat protein